MKKKLTVQNGCHHNNCIKLLWVSFYMHIFKKYYYCVKYDSKGENHLVNVSMKSLLIWNEKKITLQFVTKIKNIMERKS